MNDGIVCVDCNHEDHIHDNYELAKDLKTYWMSFVDPELPEGARFVGACIVQGFGMKDAFENSHLLKCNPGGEVKIIDMSEHKDKINEKWIGRLMNKEEAESDCYTK